MKEERNNISQSGEVREPSLDDPSGKINELYERYGTGHKDFRKAAMGPTGPRHTPSIIKKRPLGDKPEIRDSSSTHKANIISSSEGLLLEGLKSQFSQVHYEFVIPSPGVSVVNPFFRTFINDPSQTLKRGLSSTLCSRRIRPPEQELRRCIDIAPSFIKWCVISSSIKNSAPHDQIFPIVKMLSIRSSSSFSSLDRFKIPFYSSNLGCLISYFFKYDGIQKRF